MSRRLRSILVLLALVMVLAAGYAIIELVKPFDKPVEAWTPPSYPDPLLSVDPGTVVRVSLAGASTIVFERHGNGYRLVQPSLAQPRLQVSKVAQLFSALARIAPEELVLDPADDGAAAARSAEFGLDHPVVASADFSDGSRFELELGGYSPGGKIYARQRGDARIWTLSSWGNELMLQDLVDFRDRSLPFVELQDLGMLAIRVRGTTIRLEQGDPNEDGFFMSHLRLTAPYWRPLPVDADALGRLMERIQPFSIASFVDVPVSLANLGLNPPQVDLLIGDSRQQLHLLAGREVPDKPGEVYAKLADNPLIFTIDSAALTFAMDASPFALLSKLPMLIPIDSVDTITVDHAGRQHSLSIERGPPHETAGAERGESFFANGRPMEDKLFRQAYQALIGLALEGELPASLRNSIAREPALTITFKRNAGRATAVYRLFNVSRDFMAFQYDSELWFAISVSQVERAMANFEALINQGSWVTGGQDTAPEAGRSESGRAAPAAAQQPGTGSIGSP
jgi:hypothetical protein